MAKKRFTDDLFELFEDPKNTGAERQEDAVPSQQEEEEVEVSVPVQTSRAKRKLSSKKFTADLDAFLNDSFDQEQASSTAPEVSAGQSPRTPSPRPTSRRRGRKRSGLDYLIRSTVRENDPDQERGGNTADTKRVTLIFNKEHLAILKAQAKERGIYLKDVVQEMVSSYLEE
ncbi:hypothetical protein [Lewinella sp. W8]|uniref:hypothetical protein n=1 Tax=Lewinella sp. W8 TaxID=2528208 RepID=UPI0010689832|nr:hypothetical protein [Lewinella sp. W8]MTB53138.1 hypothetical protein [Lewinella sp. W8]